MKEYHKPLKQNVSVGKSSTKASTTQTTRFFAALLAYSKREGLKLKHGLGHFRLKAPLYAVGLKARYHQLARLTS